MDIWPLAAVGEADEFLDTTAGLERFRGEVTATPGSSADAYKRSTVLPEGAL